MNELKDYKVKVECEFIYCAESEEEAMDLARLDFRMGEGREISLTADLLEPKTEVEK